MKNFWLLRISVILISVVLFGLLWSFYFCKDCEQFRFILLLLVILIYNLFSCLLLQKEYKLSVNNTNRPHFNTLSINVRDVYIARYNHLNTEISRYRDLSWKIGVLTWGIYSALFLLLEKKYYEKISPDFPNLLFLIFMFLTAWVATLFLFYSENMVIRNQSLRRLIERNLGLKELFRHKQKLESVSRFGFWFSLFVFCLMIWIPPLFFLWAL